MEVAGSKSSGDWSDSVDIESERVKRERASRRGNHRCTLSALIGERGVFTKGDRV